RRHSATRKAQLKKDGLIYAFFEFNRICFDFLGSYPNGFLANHIARTINRVYPNIHHGAATGKAFVQPPLVGVADPEAALPLEKLDCSKFAGSTHAHHFNSLRFEMHAIAYK